MQKVITKKYNKIWGYEIWLYSPIEGKETLLENGEKTTKGPLVKIIHADQPLSVQVHPDDHFAQTLENQPNGKSECWYVLDHEDNASIVIGLKTYDKYKIVNAIQNKTFKELLQDVKVHKGDYFNIPAGLVHGIGAGVTVLEVQQPSDVTYRYYDYDRLENGKPRELHIAKALEVQKDLSYELEPCSTNPLSYVNEAGKQIFMTTPERMDFDSIVVNLDNYETFVVKMGEKVDMHNYCVIPLTNLC